MLIEIHMLKNYPPTNLNRDETGAPKTCTFSGVNHGRISSQCLKRSWRKSDVFQKAIGEDNLGIRTRRMPDLVCDILVERGMPESWRDAVASKLTGITNKDGKSNDKGHYTPQIVFYAPSDLEAVADGLMELIGSFEDEKVVKKLKAKEIQSVIKGASVRPITVDIALFGRMVTADEFADVDAAMQVAHAISTNRVVVESDFYTAMDDLLLGDSMETSGSAMMGDIDYDSSCYYVYSCIDVDALKKNLSTTPHGDKLAEKAVTALLEAMAYTNPSGKQNSFAGHVLPSAVMVQCKDKHIPVSLVNAYSKPAHPTGNEDLVENSIRKLVEETDSIDKSYGIPINQRLWFVPGGSPENKPSGEATVCNTYPELIAAVSQAMMSAENE